MAYSLSHDLYLLIESALNQDREKTDVVARAIESSIRAIDDKADDKKQVIKAELYNDLRNELATKEFVRAEINAVKAEISSVKVQNAEIRAEIAELRSEIKQLAFMMKLLIGFSIFGLTLFNPAFVKFIELSFK